MISNTLNAMLLVAKMSSHVRDHKVKLHMIGGINSLLKKGGLCRARSLLRKYLIDFAADEGSHQPSQHRDLL